MNNHPQNHQEHLQGLFVGREIKWVQIKGHGFRVKSFLPFASVEDGRVRDVSKFMPYAYLEVECPAFRREDTRIYMPVVHKLDFSHFWELYAERRVSPGEEVIVQYVPNKKGLRKFLGWGLPHLLITVSPKGSLERIYNADYCKDLDDWKNLLDRSRSIVTWSPEEGRDK